MHTVTTWRRILSRRIRSGTNVGPSSSLPAPKYISNSGEVGAKHVIIGVAPHDTASHVKPSVARPVLGVVKIVSEILSKLASACPAAGPIQAVTETGLMIIKYAEVSEYLA